MYNKYKSTKIKTKSKEKEKNEEISNDCQQLVPPKKRRKLNDI